MHQNEERMRNMYEKLEQKCPNPKCGKNLIMTNVGPWCANPDCIVTVAANYKPK